MISRAEAETVVAGEFDLLDSSGGLVGPLRRIFLDDYTGWPSFATVELDPNAGTQTFVALHEAEVDESSVRVPYALEFIRSAPQVDEDAALSPQEEDALFDYYSVPIEGVLPAVEHLGSVLDVDGVGGVEEIDTDDLA